MDSDGERLEVGALSETGYTREENQDRMSGAQVPLGHLYIVADGMGGHKGGALAAQMAVEELQRHIGQAAAGESADSVIEAAFKAANDTVYQRANSGDSAVEGMGTTAVLLLIYIGYLAIRRVTDNPTRRARWAAVIGIVGFIDVPIVHLSVIWWRSLHQGPTVLRLGGPEIHGTMLLALLVGVAAFTLVYAYLMTLRLRVGRLEERAAREALSPQLGAPTPEEVAS